MNRTALWTWAAHDVRRRPWRLLALALFVAVGTGVALSAAEGARRSSTALDRSVAAIVPADGIVAPNEPGFDWAPVARLDAVADLVRFPVLYFEVDGLGEVGGFPPADRHGGVDWERPILLAGRLADPDRADEVTISPAVAAGGVGVGDRLTIRLVSMSAALSGDRDPPRRDVEVEVVGITKGSFFSADVQPTYAFFVAHEDLAVGEHGYVNALVRLREGADLTALERGIDEAAGRPVEVLSVHDMIDGARRATGVETAGLAALAAAALLAVIVLVGQAIARLAGGHPQEIELLGQLGVPARWAAASSVVATAAAVAAGLACTPIVAYACSSAYPIGVGRELEPSMGRQVDWTVLLPLSALVALCFGAALAVAARRAVREPADRVDAERGALADLLQRAPLSVPASLGARLAWLRRPGMPAARSVTWIVAGGVGGVVAAVTFAAGLAQTIDRSELFGQDYDAGTQIFGATFGAEDYAAIDPERLTRLVNLVVQVDGQPVSTVAAEDLIGEFRPVLRAGRAPAAPDEVALSPASLATLHVGIGDVVDVSGRPATVVGEVLVPEVGHSEYTSGMVVHRAELQRLLDQGLPIKFELIAIDLADGVDVEAALDRLGEDVRWTTVPWPRPQRQADLEPVGPLPVLFGGFVAFLTLGSAAHAIASTARQRRAEVAVLQVLGLTRRQARRTVLWHAACAAAAGVAVGAPLGHLIGRTLWRATADSLPALHRAPGAAPAAAVVVAALALALAVSAWPARRTAVVEPALVLRAE